MRRQRHGTIEAQYDLAPCGSSERWGTCRGEETIDLENNNLAPRVSISSGDLYYDENTVRAVLMVNPLPAPPRAGVTVFVFRSEVD